MGGRYATHKGAFDKTEGRQYYWIVNLLTMSMANNLTMRKIFKWARTGRGVCEKRLSVVVETHNDTDNLQIT